MFSTLGVRVTVIDKRSKVHDFVDAEIIDSLVYQMRQIRRTVRLGEEAKLKELRRVWGDDEPEAPMPGDDTAGVAETPGMLDGDDVWS